MLQALLVRFWGAKKDARAWPNRARDDTRQVKFAKPKVRNSVLFRELTALHIEHAGQRGFLPFVWWHLVAMFVGWWWPRFPVRSRLFHFLFRLFTFVREVGRCLLHESFCLLLGRWLICCFSQEKTRTLWCILPRDVNFNNFLPTNGFFVKPLKVKNF